MRKSLKKYSYNNHNKNRIASKIKDSPYFPIIESTKLDAYLKEYISRVIQINLFNKIHELAKEKSTSIKHHCYECHKPISVDLSNLIFGNGKLLNYKNFMCDEHKSTRIKTKTSFIWYRYEASFYNKVKKIIKYKNEIFENWN